MSAIILNECNFFKLQQANSGEQHDCTAHHFGSTSQQRQIISLFLLIASLTLLVNLGVMVLVSTTDYLDACDEGYTTIGVVEYIGAVYPDSLAYDPRLAELLSPYEFSALTSLPCVQRWERSARALGSVAGYQRADPAMPEKMTAVLIIGNISYIDSICMYSA